MADPGVQTDGGPEQEPRQARRRLTLELSPGRIAHLDSLKREWGLRNRGDVLERLLDALFPPEADPATAPIEGADGVAAPAGASSRLDEEAALVLVNARGSMAIAASLDSGADTRETASSEPRSDRRQAQGIDLPGFVRRRTGELRRSLRPPQRAEDPAAPLPHLAADEATTALEVCREHWLNLYGTAANAAVLEAAMSWLAHDIWPQCEPVEGQAFTWSAASTLMEQLVEGWERKQPSFERVIVTAGVLEDPFGAATLVMRIPTLIHRFVQRFRRRPRGTSFQTLEHTMTLQGALRLLDLPTEMGQRVTLQQIREAYREMALRHHPDSGGSVEVMRRLNEAYQLLKELYRRPEGS